MITEKQAAAAVTLMLICRYFPADTIQRAQIGAMLIEMVNTEAELDWLVNTQCKLDWKGPAELRGLFCSRFNPRDGFSLESETPGFRVRDAEAAYFERQDQERRRELVEWKAQKLLSTPEGEEPIPVLAVKQIAHPDRTTQDLLALASRDRLASVAGVAAPPRTIHISATPVRTPEERARLERELAAEIEIRHSRGVKS